MRGEIEQASAGAPKRPTLDAADATLPDAARESSREKGSKGGKQILAVRHVQKKEKSKREVPVADLEHPRILLLCSGVPGTWRTSGKIRKKHP